GGRLVKDALEAALAGAHPERDVRERLAAYAEMLRERNRHVNLTAARDVESLAAHILDSLSVLPFVREPLIDVGSGGGFPGLPLAIATGWQVTLVESVAKKARFLEEVVVALSVPVRVVCARAEEAGHDPALREAFASATARALASAPAVLELTVPFLRCGGVAAVQRGLFPLEERQAAADAALMLGAAVSGEIVLEASEAGGGGRRILLVTKLTPTAARFPRRSGVPAKRPLCLGNARPREAALD
ncbi:MAG: 16S rRNA (guanine(527)-N(7))-methyltransferase RsmG, partial [Candidatus Baltobacteraceae bacterium]